MLKNYLFSPLCSAPFLYSSPLFLSASTPHTSSFFSVSWSTAPFSSSLFFQRLFLLLFFFFFPLSFTPLSSFLLDVLPFFYQPKKKFSAQNVFYFSPKRFFQPKTFLPRPKYFFSSAQKYYFQPKTFLLQPKILFQFSPKISPCLWFSASFFLFLFCL